MLTILDTIDDLLEEWKSLQPVSDDIEKKIQQKFRLEFNYNSNHLEGNTLTYGETKLLLLFDDTKGNHNLREYEEMKAHDVAWRMVEEYADDKERPLTEQMIRKLHEIILVRPFWKDAMTNEGQETKRLIDVGVYKKHPNSVRLPSGEIFEYASVVDTPILMQELLGWYNSESQKIHPAELAAMLHYRFVRIHPFDDGNGRIARLLMNFVLLRAGLPPVIIKSEEKGKYLQALHQADAGDFQTFTEYIAGQLVWSLSIVLKAAKGEAIDEEEDWRKKLSLLRDRIEYDKILIISEELVEKVLNEKILVLLESVYNELSSFDSLFTEKVIEFKGTTGYYRVPDFFLMKNMIRETPSNFRDDGYFNYQLKGFKFSDDHNLDCHISIKWQFKRRHYEVLIKSFGSEPVVRKGYGDALTDEEIKMFVGYCGKEMMTQIEKLNLS